MAKRISSPKPERYGTNMGSSRKQITFDLSQEALKQFYPHKETAKDPQFFKKAYKDIQRFMEGNGFDWRQYSVYVSRSELTTLDVVLLAKRMAEHFPWLRQCIKEITATNIGARYSLLGLLRPDALPVQMKDGPASGWGFYIIADLKTWADNAEDRSPLEHFPFFEEAKARFEELRSKRYNSEAAEPGSDGQPPARLTLGLESADGMSSADILHVRKGKNYLVTDFIQMERLRDDPAVMDILSRVSREIGFDCVRVREKVEGKRQLLSTVPFAEWDNPYFPAATPGRIAAQYCELLHQCYPLPQDESLRAGQIAEIVQFVQKEGSRGINQMALSAAGFRASFRDNPAVQKLFSALMTELSRYNKAGRDEAQRRKPKHKRSQER